MNDTVSAEVLCYAYYSQDILSQLAKHLPDGWSLTGLHKSDDETTRLAKLGAADFIIISDLPFAEAEIAAARRLKLLHKKGVGYESVDLSALRRRGIPLCICPEGTSESVAEQAILLMLAVRNRIVEIDADVRRGEWPKWTYRSTQISLKSSTVGLVGFGRIGQEVARRLAAFGSTVLAYVRSPGKYQQASQALSVPLLTDLVEVASRVDVLSVHVPYTDQSHHLVDARVIGALRPHAIVVNTSRGGTIDQRALCAALGARAIAGAGLDVLSQEPPAPDDPILSTDRVVLSGHTAGGGLDIFDLKAPVIFGNMQAALAGTPLLHQVP